PYPALFRSGLVRLLPAAIAWQLLGAFQKGFSGRLMRSISLGGHQHIFDAAIALQYTHAIRFAIVVLNADDLAAIAILNFANHVVDWPRAAAIIAGVFAAIIVQARIEGGDVALRTTVRAGILSIPVAR